VREIEGKREVEMERMNEGDISEQKGEQVRGR
jgi:hypothetical protein